MENQVFRKKSIDRVSSPEQLSDYIRVSNPGVWIVLAAVIVLLAGAFVWGVYGRLETTLPALAVSENGRVVCYLKETEADAARAGMTVRIGENEYTVEEIAEKPQAVTEAFSEYALHVGDMQIGEWVYEMTLSGDMTDGVYGAVVVTDSVSPLSFVFP